MSQLQLSSFAQKTVIRLRDIRERNERMHLLEPASLAIKAADQCKEIGVEHLDHYDKQRLLTKLAHEGIDANFSAGDTLVVTLVR